jgi:flagellar hook-associated protein 2
VTRDTGSVSTAINNFVKAYNTLNSTITSLTAYNADTKAAGALQGDATARGIQSQLRAALGKAVQGLGGGLTTLSQVGIAFQKDGSLAVDSGKLSKAMTEKYDDIAGLFAAVGKATDGMISVSSNSTKTQAGNYAVNISQMATQGSLKSESALAASTTIAANTTWTVTLNQTDPVTASKVQNIAIPAGTYDQKQLAAMLRSAINGDTDFAGSGDTVETSVDADGKLSISSSKYGEASNIAIASLTGTKVEDLFGATTKPAKGLNVAGTIGGLAATGNGQTLTAMAGSAVEGLQLAVTGGAAGDRGSVSFSQGYAFQLNTLAASFIGTTGMVTSKTTGLNATVTSIQKQTDAFNTRLTAIEARYRAQFTALDTMLSSMQTTQSYLTQQLAAIAANAANLDLSENLDVWNHETRRQRLCQRGPGNRHRLGLAAQADRHAVRRRAGRAAERQDQHRREQYRSEGHRDLEGDHDHRQRPARLARQGTPAARSRPTWTPCTTT